MWLGIGWLPLVVRCDNVGGLARAAKCTYPLPAEVQMFLAMKCLWAKRIAVGRATGDHQTVSWRRRISGRTMELVNGHESFLALSNRGALSIVDASFKYARASYLNCGVPWSNCAFGAKRVFGVVIGVCAGLTCTCRIASEKGFAFAVREGCRELVAEVGQVSVRTRLTRSSRSVRARSRALRSIAPEVGSVPVRTRMRCRLP